MEDNNFNINDEVYVSPKSIGKINCSANDFHPEKAILLKITPKRFKISWDCDGQIDIPYIMYVKRIYKNYDDVKF